MKIKIKRGTATNLASLTPEEGEPIFTTDTKELHMGDGATQGGIPVGTVKPTGSIVADMLALFSDTTGKVIKGISKADFLAGYATETFVTDKITQTVPGTKVASATNADKAADADLLKGRADYLNPDNITTSYQEDNADKVVAASGVKALWEALKTTYIAVADKTDALDSTDGSKVFAAVGAKVLKTQIDAVDTKATSALALQTDVQANKAQLGKLPGQILHGAGNAPTTGVKDGDIYLKYK